MYVNRDGSGEIFTADVGIQGSGTGAQSFVDTLSQSEEGFNDGAACASALGPLPPQGALAGTVFDDANTSASYDTGDTGLPDILVSLFDDRGTIGDTSDDVFLSAQDSAGDGSYLFADLDAALTYRVEVSTTDANLPPGRALSTPNPYEGIEVTAGSTRGGLDFGFAPNSSSADLSLTKIVRRASDAQETGTAAVGEALDFVLTLSNAELGIATGVQVRDLLPSGFTYVSDDAAAMGDSYDPGTGIWDLGDVLASTSHSLTIRVTMLATGVHTNQAEIVASSVPDPDSDPASGALVDDLGDGIADDDEASASVTLTDGGATLSGLIFFDNGINATAYDGQQSGDEAGTDRALVRVLDGGGTLIASPIVNADGGWTLTLPAGYADAVTITTLPGPDLRLVSETGATLPGLVNPDPRDGTLTFTPVPGTTYGGLDMGLIGPARLNESQQAALRPGQVKALRHEYLPQAPGDVVFDIDVLASSSPGTFTAALYLDDGCDGSPDTAITAALPAQPGVLICLVARVSASAGAAQGASYRFDVIATTTYGATALVEEDRNTDVLRAESGQGTLKLTKTVRNVTQGTPEGVSNGAAAGDVLEYRIQLQNMGTLPAASIRIFDRTPAYTVLDSPVPSPASVGSGVTCTLTKPASNSAGYAGDLQWDCTGSYPPGDLGAVTFQVRISP
ncbi:DUF11 domain-containing protein [Pseudooceanicola aestuarii]|uniref:DUF11 domain-containing protein n=1 Tax=Pseudooceanicola aestuarii TaxID=2697319 RepID=UPI001EF808E8|nr:DUF11 domain-containing protein [Pseudooceanicola aestuarii]